MEARLQASIIQYLKSKLPSVADPDALSVGIDVLTEAFGVPGPDHNVDLLTTFAAGFAATPGAAAATASTTTSSPLFVKFLDSLKGKGFFDGVEEGSPEYVERYNKVVAKFEARAAAAAAPPIAASAAPAPAAKPATAAAGDDAGAEAAKEEGNRHVAAARYAQAVECYTDALEKAPAGKNVHVYFSNRAAARTHLKDLDGAVDDARAAIAAQPSYAKAHARLATALQLMARLVICSGCRGVKVVATLPPPCEARCAFPAHPPNLPPAPGTQRPRRRGKNCCALSHRRLQQRMALRRARPSCERARMMRTMTRRTHLARPLLAVASRACRGASRACPEGASQAWGVLGACLTCPNFSGEGCFR